MRRSSMHESGWLQKQNSSVIAIGDAICILLKKNRVGGSTAADAMLLESLNIILVTGGQCPWTCQLYRKYLWA